jgi:hypothetical protein
MARGGRLARHRDPDVEQAQEQAVEMTGMRCDRRAPRRLASI